jgi:hypothetical protein
MEKARFLDRNETIYSMMDEFLVVCPHCEACARMFRLDPDCEDWFAPRRLVCAACGHSKDWAGRVLIHGGTAEPPVDSCFQLPLWLKTNCRGKTLWAYNLRHLQLIESYVRAALREHRHHGELGWHNNSLVNRLPKWITSRRNRDEVLKAIARIRKSVVD